MSETATPTQVWRYSTFVMKGGFITNPGTLGTTTPIATCTRGQSTEPATGQRPVDALVDAHRANGEMSRPRETPAIAACGAFGGGCRTPWQLSRPAVATGASR